MQMQRSWAVHQVALKRRSPLFFGINSSPRSSASLQGSQRHDRAFLDDNEPPSQYAPCMVNEDLETFACFYQHLPDSQGDDNDAGTCTATEERKKVPSCPLPNSLVLQSGSQDDNGSPSQFTTRTAIEEGNEILPHPSPKADPYQHQPGSQDDNNAEVGQAPKEQQSHGRNIITKAVKQTRKFICNICQKAATTASNLRSHLSTHEPTKRHECGWPDCSLKFNRKSDVTRHRQTHFQATPHICKFCRKEFSRNDSVKRHNRKPCKTLTNPVGAGSS
ncbi:hypothetical protein BX616_010881 [Lobosporangium transversale]|uniref:C2H2-type domain-containing protein n=1 Tax=Lobosporangium transversale TaxID=64571 RepID=A0A1Y2G9M9_9FUNG|nr:hypothetical protein BCR41DRAFT_363362 [Lobosporangium transversale]KAF9910364.1 hypothetical protein BX616_010881 [Lobosporangium transversale]ORZ01951.1 hypothetical protein BCR41DRAFT_363362 [Lobosporangium transversale]|eukprot:XP_021876204.1 hypothetical protein BCR41DRAFT_363362 [Lobosporangium transversale]